MHFCHSSIRRLVMLLSPFQRWRKWNPKDLWMGLWATSDSKVCAVFSCINRFHQGPWVDHRCYMEHLGSFWVCPCLCGAVMQTPHSHTGTDLCYLAAGSLLSFGPVLLQMRGLSIEPLAPHIGAGWGGEQWAKRNELEKYWEFSLTPLPQATFRTDDLRKLLLFYFLVTKNPIEEEFVPFLGH